jgi:hypothetical protein
MIDADECGEIGGMNDWQGKLKYKEETIFTNGGEAWLNKNVDSDWNLDLFA